jgi:tetratricopeptide (TPR) repeat protein
MGFVDQFGVPLTAADGVAVRQLDVAVSKLLAFSNDPLAEIDRAIAFDSRLPMGYVVKGLLYALSTDRSLLPEAWAALAAGKDAAVGACAREISHVAAIETWLRGKFTDACAVWEDILVEYPNDAIAMFAAHQGDFLLGRSSELRDRVARRLPDIDKGSALEGYYMGMYAFGLEEMADYDRAADMGHCAVERDRHDAWAIHAVAHVLEMTNRIEEGEQWLSSRVSDRSIDSSLAVHIAWHLGLFYLDQGRWDRALELYDARIRRPQSTMVMELLDASALLWRLTLQRVPVANRWQDAAAVWEPHIEDAWYAFNDMHAMMAFAGAGRADLARRLIGVLEATAALPSENGAMTREIGLPVAAALFAYSEERYATVVECLRPVIPIAARAGGSHAQRDVLAQTLVSAAEKSGQIRLARALLNERLEIRPRSALNQAWMRRAAGTLPPRADRQ